jgi:transposase
MHAKGTGITEIARALSIDRKTVYRYIDQDDFSPKPPIKTERPSKLDPYRSLIESWLEDDCIGFHKQRHTNRRITERLKEEHGFTCAENTVSDYIRKHNLKKKSSARESLDLIWEPGYAQADFGQADCIIDGRRMRCHFLILAFPYSNMGFAQMFFGETAECICQGLKDIFAHIGGVPKTIVFDNATGLGRRMHGEFVESDLFSRFRAHYRFESRYCNPAAGWEKGCAERKVAFLRSELLVPVPVIDDIERYNADLLVRCAFQEGDVHYTKGICQGVLFDKDSANLLTLPSKPFDAVRYEHVTTDGYGHITIDECHLYSSVPDVARQEVIAGIGAHSVVVLDKSGTVLALHRRQFSKSRTESIDAASQLRLLTRRPKGWRNSKIRESMPEAVVAHLDALDTDGLRHDLKLLYETCERSGLQATLDALDVLAREHEDFPDFFQVGVLAARIADFGLDTPPEGGADLSCYDELFLGGGSNAQ